MTPATLHAARQVLPAWVVWAPLLAPLLAVPVTMALVWTARAIAGRGLRRLPPDAHWTERARHVMGVRIVGMVCACLACIALTPLGCDMPVSMGGSIAHPVAALLVCATAFVLAARFENATVRRVPPAVRFRSMAAVLLVSVPSYSAMALPLLWPSAFLDARSIIAYAAVVVVLASGGGLALATALGLVRPAPDRVRAACARVAQRAPLPRLFVVPALMANAWAIRFPRAIVVTDGLLETLDDDQLAGVLAHELAHLREPRWATLVSMLVACAVPVVPIALAITGRPQASLAGLALTTLAFVGHLRVRRAMERRCDASAGETCPGFATALERIAERNLTPAVLRRKTSHPDLFDRMAASGSPPAWPRPAPPPSLLPALGPVALATALLVTAFSWPWPGHDEAAALVAVARWGRAPDLGYLATQRYARGAFDEALPLLRAARELEPTQADWPTWEAGTLAALGRCQEARAVLESAAALDDGRQFTWARQALSTCGGAR